MFDRSAIKAFQLRRPPIWVISLAALLLIAAVVALAFVAPPWSRVPSDELRRLEGLTGTDLIDEQTRYAILKLELENASSASFWGLFSTIVGAGTAIFGGLAILATIWKQISDRADQARQDRQEREAQHQRDFHESFRTTVENLGAQAVSLRASAAATLATLLRPEYTTYHDDVLLVALAKAKEGMEESEAVQRLVSRVVELALRNRLPTASPSDRRYFLDLSRCLLKRVDLSELDLTGADVAFADLSEADLGGAALYRCHGFGVRLERARLGARNGRAADLSEARLRRAIAPGAQFHEIRGISLRIEDANLRGAEFYRAQLQEAHFDGAELFGAKFQEANLNNAYFRGAKLDDPALVSIAKGAKHWQEAHFDAEDLERLHHFARD